MRNLLFIISASLALVACEGNTDRFWFFTNKSSQPISVNTLHAGKFFQVVQDTVQPGEQIQLAQTNQMGGVVSADEDPGISFVAWQIETLQGDTCTKNHHDAANWSPSVTSVSKIPSNQRHEYHFSVSDSDF
jgi:hypothetical protein